MLRTVIQRTQEYTATMPKAERKRYGQFFTSEDTARFMADLFDIPTGKRSISVLDAGAGSGILACAFLERLNRMNTALSVELTCYETDENIWKLLKENLEYCKRHVKYEVTYQIRTENYITSQQTEFHRHMNGEPVESRTYDYVIGNPPYRKLPKDAPEAVAMKEVCHGAPNMYFLFVSMGLENLKDGGEMVEILPRSWTSGVYFKCFRQYFLTQGKLKHVHLFVSRNKVFDKEDVLQETIIVKAQKTTRKPETVTITTTQSNADFADLKSVTVPYELAVSGENDFVFLPTQPDEIAVLEKMRKFHFTLPKIGVRAKTGLIVNYRNREILRAEEEKGAMPLFCSRHIQNGEIRFPTGATEEYLVTDKEGFAQGNRNYLFLKRIAVKEAPRRLRCGVYLAKNFPQYDKISTQNNINFLDGVDTAMRSAWCMDCMFCSIRCCMIPITEF